MLRAATRRRVAATAIQGLENFLSLQRLWPFVRAFCVVQSCASPSNARAYMHSQCAGLESSCVLYCTKLERPEEGYQPMRRQPLKKFLLAYFHELKHFQRDLLIDNKHLLMK